MNEGLIGLGGLSLSVAYKSKLPNFTEWNFKPGSGIGLLRALGVLMEAIYSIFDDHSESHTVVVFDKTQYS